MLKDNMRPKGMKIIIIIIIFMLKEIIRTCSRFDTMLFEIHQANGSPLFSRCIQAKTEPGETPPSPPASTSAANEIN